jgi:membrane protein implicated in regulation of membrane protease activity
MLDSIFGELGPWNWMVLGFILLTLEILAPGVFLLWIGIAALLVGALSLQLWDVAWWTWQVQVLVFLALSLVSAYVGHRIMRDRQTDSDEPLLNRRDAQLVGRTATLQEPILEGRGRIRIDDTSGRSVRARMRRRGRARDVKVIAASGGELTVEKWSDGQTAPTAADRGNARRRPAAVLDHDQRADLVLVEIGDRRARRHVGVRRFLGVRHDLLDRYIAQVAVQIARHVAVGDDAGQRPSPSRMMTQPTFFFDSSITASGIVRAKRHQWQIFALRMIWDRCVSEAPSLPPG